MRALAPVNLAMLNVSQQPGDVGRRLVRLPSRMCFQQLSRIHSYMLTVRPSPLRRMLERLLIPPTATSRSLCRSTSRASRCSILTFAQLFKIFRKLWTNPDADDVGNNPTEEYLRYYIKDRDAKAQLQFSGDLKSPAFFLKAFGHRAAYLVGNTVRRRDIERRSWNSLLVDMFRLSKAHSEYLVVRSCAFCTIMARFRSC